MLPLQPPAQIQSPPPAPLGLPEALAQLQDRYDLHGDGAALALPAVAAKDRPAVRWLHAALTQDHPDNPFPRGRAGHAEAEAVRAFLALADPTAQAAGLARLPLELAGSQMAVWRWGRRLERRGQLPADLRRAWEDRLRRARPATLAASYALRHALCFALADADEARLAELKAAHAADSPDLVLAFQRLFGLLGSPGPGFRLWEGENPSLVERRFRDLRAARIWICPPDPAFAPPPAEVAWIVPLGTGEGAVLQDAELWAEAEQVRRAHPASRTWFAPERADFEACGLSLFPVLVTLGLDGSIAAIRMGEAAPAKP